MKAVFELSFAAKTIL